MALALPLSRANLSDLLQVATVDWTLSENQELSDLGGGETLAADLGPRLWLADCTSIEADIDTIEALRARANTLDGAIQSFYLHDARRPFPATDPTGTLLAAANVTISSIEVNRKELTFTGLPAGFVLPAGTLFSVTAGNPSRTALMQLAAAVTASGGAGVAGPVEVRPHLRPWIAATQTVTLLKPVAKVKLVPKSLSVAHVTGATYRLRLSARQTLAAG